MNCKNEFVQVLPSRFPIEGYVRLKLRCYCCRQLIRNDPDAEYRKEDLDNILKTKPLCSNCAIHLKKWQQEIQKLEKSRLTELENHNRTMDTWRQSRTIEEGHLREEIQKLQSAFTIMAKRKEELEKQVASFGGKRKE